MSNTVAVSIICNAFNHVKYIEKTLEGFVNQQTTYSYEVLIHDDCSTDGTTEIIKRYQKLYPHIIKPIFQTENQFSKGIHILNTYQLPRAKGKYIALCEGDDSWTDVNKLQLQVDYMESHPKCTFCFTNAIIKNVRNGKERLFLPYNKSDVNHYKGTGVYSLDEVANLAFLPTCTFLFPRNNYDCFPEDFWKKSWAGDRKISLYSTALGYAYCIDEVTAQYSYAVSGSLMTSKKSKKKIAEIERERIILNNDIDLFSNGIATTTFEKQNLESLVLIYKLCSTNQMLSEEELTVLKRVLSVKDRIIHIVLFAMPDSMFELLRQIKRLLFV